MVNGMVVTYPNKSLSLYDGLSLSVLIYYECFVDYFLRLNDKKVYFRSPRFLKGSWIMNYWFVFKYPRVEDMAFPLGTLDKQGVNSKVAKGRYVPGFSAHSLRAVEKWKY